MTAAQPIGLFDGQVSLGAVTMTSATTWSKTIRVADGPRSYQARGPLGIPVSQKRTLTKVKYLSGSENFDNAPPTLLVLNSPVEMASKLKLTLEVGDVIWGHQTCFNLDRNPNMWGRLFVVGLRESGFFRPAPIPT